MQPQLVSKIVQKAASLYSRRQMHLSAVGASVRRTSYSNTTVYCEIHESSECISVDCGVTNLIHDRRSCVDFTPEVRRMWLDVSTQA